MSTFLSDEVKAGLEAARKAAQRKGSRLRVHVGEDTFPVLRLWEIGFAMEAEVAPKLRGLVDLHHGGVHLYQCLIVASSEEGDEMQYEFKRKTAATDAPALDYSRDPNAPVALLPR
ncbi:hypothetical protein [Cognatishimia sp. MH4019]|uniref:hypothetical protein n=1 Tax=Cognatishimia sp. MH4019 TaxID=2854030 RepID=UPI001CD6B39F|nr:hypothetical protein [Cognatishimia sp. MH4019]